MKDLLFGQGACRSIQIMHSTRLESTTLRPCDLTQSHLTPPHPTSLHPAPPYAAPLPHQQPTHYMHSLKPRHVAVMNILCSCSCSCSPALCMACVLNVTCLDIQYSIIHVCSHSFYFIQKKQVRTRLSGASKGWPTCGYCYVLNESAWKHARTPSLGCGKHCIVRQIIIVLLYGCIIKNCIIVLNIFLL